MPDYFVHESSYVDEGAEVGAGTKIWHFCHVMPGAKIGIISYGSADPAVLEARDRLRKQGIETDYLRVRALPIEETLTEFVARHDRIYVIELNFEGQMAEILCMELPEYAPKLRRLTKCDGLPLTARFLTESIMEQEQ